MHKSVFNPSPRMLRQFASIWILFFGAMAAWLGGVVDRALMAIADALLAIPRLVLLLVCAALWRPGLATVVVVLPCWTV